MSTSRQSRAGLIEKKQLREAYMLDLGHKAIKLLSQGLSWTNLAIRLGCNESTIRRAVKMVKAKEQCADPACRDAGFYPEQGQQK
jgi:DNA-binding CsgD family transcriptional regulator